MEGDRDGLVVLEDALRAAQALLELVHVVDDDEALAELGLELRDDVHAVFAHVLERRVADGERRVERDEVDGGDVVQLGVGHAGAAELRRGAGRGHASGDLPGGEPVPERHEPGDVLADREHPRRLVGRVRELVVRLEVLGHVHDAAAVHAGEEADAPAPQRVDQDRVPALRLPDDAGFASSLSF